MPFEVKQDLNSLVLNMIANIVHDAAIAIMGDVSHMKGCAIQSFKPDEAVFISNYCGGVLEHMPGGALVHTIPMAHINIEGKLADVVWGSDLPTRPSNP